MMRAPQQQSPQVRGGDGAACRCREAAVAFRAQHAPPEGPLRRPESRVASGLPARVELLHRPTLISDTDSVLSLRISPPPRPHTFSCKF